MYDEKQDICIVRVSPQKVLSNYKGEDINFKVEKLRRHHSRYVIKVPPSLLVRHINIRDMSSFL